MSKKIILLVFSFFSCLSIWSQNSPPSKDPIYDTDVDYDALFSELDDFLDSLLKPRSFAVANVSVGSNFFDYSSKNNGTINSERHLIVVPSLAYYDRSGFGISASANILKEKNQFTPFQFAGSLSYDYLQNMNFAMGVAATHYFTKDSLSFYTSPLKNDVFAYFSYRSFWFKPTLSASYGWGSKTSYEKRQNYITALRLRRAGYTTVNTRESISDFNLMLSLRHDFYWLDVLTKKDHIRLTPQVSFSGGTQNFGFNQTSTTYNSEKLIGKNDKYSTRELNLDNKVAFQPLSIAFALKSEFSIGKFYFQPQAILNYYIPAKENNLTSSFVLNSGLYF